MPAMEKKKTFLTPSEWTSAGLKVGAAAGAVALTVACAQHCTGVHEVLGVVTTGGLIGTLPGIAVAQVCAGVDKLLH